MVETPEEEALSITQQVRERAPGGQRTPRGRMNHRGPVQVKVWFDYN